MKINLNKTINTISGFKKLNIPLIKKENGLNLYLSDKITMPCILFNGIGSILDMKIKIWGLCHFFEHYVFKKVYIKSRFNASTGMNIMYFFCEKPDIEDFKEIIGFFYDSNNEELINQKDYFDDESLIKNIAREIENEYYYRSSLNQSYNPFYTIFNRPLYAGGRLDDFKNTSEIKKWIKNVWNYIDGKDIYILIPQKFESIIPLIDKTFGTKKRTFNIPNSKINLCIPVKPKIEDPFVYITYKDNKWYSIMFKFDIQDNVIPAITILNYFTTFKIYTDYYPIGNNLIVKYSFKDLTEFKLFIYTIKNFNDDFLLNYQQLNSILEIVNTNDEDLLKEIILNYDTIVELGKKNPIDLLNTLNGYFCDLKSKINTYGEFFITAPDKNNLLQTSTDHYNSQYTIVPSSFSTFLMCNNFLYTPHNPLDLFMYNKDDYSVNYKFFSGINNKICKYNSSKYYSLTGIKNDKYYYRSMPKDSLSLILQKGIDIISIKNDYYVVRCKKRNKYLLDKIYTQYSQNYTYIDVLDINLDIDTLGKALKIFLLDNNNTSFTNIIYSILNGHIPRNVSIKNNNIYIPCDKVIEIQCPYTFVCFLFGLNDYDFNGMLLEYMLKNDGLIYYSRYNTILSNGKVYNYLFYPTVYVEEVCKFAVPYIRSFDIDCNILIIKSIKGKYDLRSLDNLFQYFKIL